MNIPSASWPGLSISAIQAPLWKAQSTSASALVTASRVPVLLLVPAVGAAVGVLGQGGGHQQGGGQEKEIHAR